MVNFDTASCCGAVVLWCCGHQLLSSASSSSGLSSQGGLSSSPNPLPSGHPPAFCSLFRPFSHPPSLPHLNPNMIASIMRRAMPPSSCLGALAFHTNRSALVQSARQFAAKSDPPNLVAEVKPGTPGEIPSILDQATGLERAEIDHPDLFKHNEVLRGPFGTHENPVMIQSAFDSRIVGCTGKPIPDDHDLVWLLVEKGDQAVCKDCQQVFELDPL